MLYFLIKKLKLIKCLSCSKHSDNSFYYSLSTTLTPEHIHRLCSPKGPCKENYKLSQANTDLPLPPYLGPSSRWWEGPRSRLFHCSTRPRLRGDSQATSYTIAVCSTTLWTGATNLEDNLVLLVKSKMHISSDPKIPLLNIHLRGALAQHIGAKVFNVALCVVAKKEKKKTLEEPKYPSIQAQGNKSQRSHAMSSCYNEWTRSNLLTSINLKNIYWSKNKL